jgi:inner membrane protein
VILQSEDYALLLGALLLFTALAIVMIMTRRVDWYRLAEEPPAAR